MSVILKGNEKITKSLFPEVKTLSEIGTIIDSVTNYNKKQVFENSKNKIKIEKKFQNTKKYTHLPYHKFSEYIVAQYIDSAYKNIYKNKILESFDYIMARIEEVLINEVNSLSIKTLTQEWNLIESAGLIDNNSEFSKIEYFNEILLNDKDYIGFILEEYPELARSIDLCIKRTIENLITLFNNTEKEWYKILKNLNLDDNAKISDFEVNLGDTHQNGKSVVSLRLNNGKYIIYKPRNLEIDLAFQSFIVYLNRKFNLQLKTVLVYTNLNEGWMEYIEFQECSTLYEVEYFYRQVGELLAVLFILNANDIHSENIIACGNNPVVIDLETLFVPKIKEKTSSVNIALKKAQETLNNSVANIALLPLEIRRIVDNKELDFDLGGVSFDKEQISPFKHPNLIVNSEGSYEIIMSNSILRPNLNNPAINGETIESSKYIDFIKQGFQNVYLNILNNKECINNKLREIFTNKEIRFLNRGTMVYSKLLSIGNYSIFNKNQEFKEILFSRLGIGSDKKNPFLYHEFRDLMNQDIPYFIANTSNTIVLNSTKESIGEIFDESPLESCINKIKNLSYEDCNRQIELIEMSFMNKKSAKDDMTNISHCSKEKLYKPNEKQIIRVCEQIAEHLISHAITSNDQAYWISANLSGKKENIWEPDIVGSDIYNGSSGIALFFSLLYKKTKKEIYKKYTYLALNSVKKKIEFFNAGDNPEKYPFGFFSGLSGELYTIYTVSEIFNDNDLEKFFWKHLDELNDDTLESDFIDVINGYAGTIIMLVNLSEKQINEYKKSKLIELAQKLERNIININTDTLNSTNVFYSGYSHGISGILLAYALLYKSTRKKIYREKCYELIDLLNFFYNEESKSWYNNNYNQEISKGWCHGAPGILLCFLKCVECGIKIKESTMEMMANNIIDTGFGNNITLCHGDLGNLTILEKYAHYSKNPYFIEKTEDLFKKMYHSYMIDIVKNKKSRHSYSSSLMIGYTGVGFYLINTVLEKSIDILTLN
ncbi:type 2 lanthipeptide synthetase LanM [Staphylococcus succinus]|uniref:type 2 lanthipeptide synthetase LanM n=1 Tax=Staphylococcus succinus TaxID=61015 RepID=UPI0015FA8A01|nr:type 2 lanthipeptide synthetase LanM [Staphylococcus succinus]